MLGYVLLLACALAVAVLVTRHVQLGHLQRDIAREQAQEVEELRVLAAEGIDPRTGLPFGRDVARMFDTYLERNVPSDNEAFYTILAGQPYRRSFNAPAVLYRDERVLRSWTSTTSPRSATFETEAGDVRSLAVPLIIESDGGTTVGGVFAVVFFPDAAERELAQVIRVAAVTGVAVLVLSSLLAWSLAGRVLRPVRELTRTARTISESDLSARIPVEGHDELAELGETFNDMVGRLEEGFRAQRRFLDDVAHELRTPITIARGHLEVLGDDPIERADTVGIVTEELDRMSRYVRDLLLLAKAEQPEFLELRPVDLGELARDALRRMSALEQRQWVLDSAPPIGTVATLADPDRLGQALVNLATNAAQHTVDGAEIGVGATADDDVARLWVRDTGSGVDQAVAKSLFDRYSRSDTSRSGRPEGAGIGLSIVDAIARAHGGTVSVVSAPGEGATFTMTIPLTSPMPRAGGGAVE